VPYAGFLFLSAAQAIMCAGNGIYCASDHLSLCAATGKDRAYCPKGRAGGGLADEASLALAVVLAVVRASDCRLAVETLSCL